ncbi:MULTISPECIES: TraR/DksA family transcriptional regulator [Pseudomonas syringae group]|uniref:TraR/DksA family transcriptional regulator n=1 Tax=Pseudomonas amygdali pv. morsprunorum TaxID=129138 RepID=A0AB35QUP1_PSEA0|nr:MULTISPECIES: TraR/DksA family transcriptional regulator [Pseudomonas syringae group]AVB14235.1 conjugal transfer protein TraR [Pseudomonas amygdali pv. morsprunorum]MBI6731006.1 TraR/DksA family transcriptional regulator [Pseudomonas amygdali]MBI6814923.1 TraR/DksA family transcriptional regulator [Pseudomonas amygdali]MDT3222855.1 TraR/DksA family transcriptional regulator [Pseudomonas amygdali pv. morsprunorum]MDT3239632.1 TraR/DksA family transcriptional regulator [Pseudomonas amygdali 
MADIADFANDLVQERIDQALAARRAAKLVTTLHSFLFCETCEEAIPDARRSALPGCTQCLTCQSLLELREARHAR